MAKSHKTFTSFSELSLIVDEFIDQVNVIEIPVDINYDDALLIENDFENVQINTNQYQVTFVDKLKSFQIPSEYFTNKIKNHRANTVLHDNIKCILKLEDSIIDIDQIPIDLIDEVRNDRLINTASTKKKQRYANILSFKGVRLDESIIKASYRNILNSQLHRNLPGDLFRIYYQKNDELNKLNIVLLDVHHLLATDPIKYKPKYNECRGYGCCIRQLIE